MAAGKTMPKTEIRVLRADEIECRVSIIRENGVSLLLYKDARVDQRILDETFTAFGWKRSHQEINGSLYCTVEVRDPETGEWIAKQDVGAEAFTEKQKSLASDSFKRACFNWGIGRELYSAPFIWIPANRTSIENRNGKLICSDHFSVKDISYGKDRGITGLSIINANGNVAFELKSGVNKAKAAKITKMELKLLNTELDRTGISLDVVRKRYPFDRLEDLTADLYNRIMTSLKATPDKESAA